MNFINQVIYNTVDCFQKDYLKCIQCKFEGCIIEYDGGAINVGYRTKSIEIASTTFYRCKGGISGAILSRSGNVNISSSCFSYCISQRYAVISLNEGNFSLESTIITDSFGEYISGFTGQYLENKNMNCTKGQYDQSFLYMTNFNTIENIICIDTSMPYLYGVSFCINNAVVDNRLALNNISANVFCPRIKIENSIIAFPSISFHTQFNEDEFFVINCRISATVHFVFNKTTITLNEATYDDFKKPVLSKCEIDTEIFSDFKGNYTDRISKINAYKVNVHDSVFFSCTSKYIGGAIELNSEFVSLNISSTSFYQCSARKGGAIYALIQTFGNMRNVCSFNCTALDESFMYELVNTNYDGFNNISMLSVIDAHNTEDFHSTVMYAKTDTMSEINITNAPVFVSLCDKIRCSRINYMTISKCESDDLMFNIDDCYFSKTDFINNTINNQKDDMKVLVYTNNNITFTDSVFFGNRGLTKFSNCADYFNCSCDVVLEREPKNIFTIVNAITGTSYLNLQCPDAFLPVRSENNKTKIIVIVTCSTATGIAIIAFIIFAIISKKKIDEVKTKSELSQTVISDFG